MKDGCVLKTAVCKSSDADALRIRIVLTMANSGAMVTTYSGMAQQKREVNRERGRGFPGPVAQPTRYS